jgi:nitroimidazol reductase NimA-like FMN-containing flavoprotein (pyridoxamine 5'-phosphate oxidase superfamily)
MRRADKEIKSKKEIESILMAGRVCHVGFADGGTPYVLAFNYGYKNGAVYIHCAPEGRKLDIIRKNPKVCVEVDTETMLLEAQEPCAYGFKYKSVVAPGRAVIVTKRADKIRGLKVIMKRMTMKDFTAFRESSLERVVLLKITLSNISGKKSGY